jgi:hypothetical protein
MPQQPVCALKTMVYFPDALIFAVDRHDSPPTSCSSWKPPKAKLPKFDSNPRSWLLFIQIFKVQIHGTLFSDAVRQRHLRKNLTT